VIGIGRGVEDEHEDDEEVRRLVAHVFIGPVGALRQTLYVSSRGKLANAWRIRDRDKDKGAPECELGNDPMCAICTICT